MQALPIRRQIGHRSGEGISLQNLGRFHEELGDKQKALAYYEQALPIWQQLGLRSSEALTLHALGRLYDGAGDRKKGLELLGLALNLYNGIGEAAHAAIVLDKMAATQADLGRFQEAVASYREAAQNYLLRRPRDTSRGRESLRRAIELAQRSGLRSQAEAARSTLQELQNPEP